MILGLITFIQINRSYESENFGSDTREDGQKTLRMVGRATGFMYLHNVTFLDNNFA